MPRCFIGAIFFKHSFISRLFTLGKNERLKSRKIIERLFRNGKNFSVSPFRISYLFDDQVFCQQVNPPGVKFGVAVGSKNFKRAVDRNRIKRLMRETYRLQKKPLQESVVSQKKHLALFVVYTGKGLPDFQTVNKQMGLILQRLFREISSPGEEK
jgi:ribonuclease P protein component